ncbi:MAG: alkaline phosphatase family protein [Candidatus Baltobacteraceae bacterium]
MNRYTLGACALAAILAGCGGGSPTAPAPSSVAGHTAAATQGKIQNLIVIIQSSRSFDNLFAGYPGADAPTQGLTSTGSFVPLKPIALTRGACKLDGTYADYFDVAYDGGKMDGWNLLDSSDPLCPYTRVKRSETRPYWKLAQRFALADKAFGSTRFGAWVERLYLIAGTTQINKNTYVIDPVNGRHEGCDSPPGTKTSLLRNGRVERFRGPFPCFTQFPTIADLLDRASVTWRFYYDARSEVLNPFDAIQDVREGPDWTRDMSVPATNVLADIANGNLAAVSWVSSPVADSDYPGRSGGPKWVAAIAAALEKSSYWHHAAIVVVWDNAGDGLYYDDVPPPQLDPMGLGFRVPMVVISPLAERGYVSHVQYEFGSILKFIEENWSLGSLGATDVRANSLGDMF